MCFRVKPEMSNEAGGDLVRRKRVFKRAWLLVPAPLRHALTKTFDPTNPRYIMWQLVVAAAFAYNAWTPLLRVCFWEENTWNIFKTPDIVADVVNFIDVFGFRPREQFYKSGCTAYSLRHTANNYRSSPYFYYDLLSLLPLEYPFAAYFILAPLFRFNRLLRIDSYWIIFNRMEMVSRVAFLWRLLRTVFYMVMVIHINACAYFIVSRIQGIGSNSFVYQGLDELPYIRCFYFSFKTAAGVGKNAKPTHEAEYIFMAFLWLQGSFIFAFILGQIKDIVGTAVRGRTEYQTSLDLVIRYMFQMGIPGELDYKVRHYLVETYATKRTLQEDATLHVLPEALRAEVVDCELKDIGIRL